MYYIWYMKINKTNTISVRIKDDLKDKLKTIADENGVTLSDMIHIILTKAVKADDKKKNS